MLGTAGRFAINDHVSPKYVHLGAIGQTDLNVFTTLPSIQGYGSIVDNTYGEATRSHDIDKFDPCALALGPGRPARLRSGHGTSAKRSRSPGPPWPPRDAAPRRCWPAEGSVC